MQFLRKVKKLPFRAFESKVLSYGQCTSFQHFNLNQFQNFRFSTTPEVQNPVASQDVLNVLQSESTSYFRNIAIIAHVDHGKTTLVDALIKKSGAGSEKVTSMDSNQLEQEKGITILSKCTGVTYNGYKINIVDTPGHSDFGGEVERIMSMVDGVALVVCAVEGPMPQTKFVLNKALKQKLKPMVVINKVDRPGARVKEVENEIFDLFCSLDCNDELLDYPLFYASAKGGWATRNMEGEKQDITTILQSVIDHIPPPKVDVSSNFSMLVSQTESNTYFGKMLIGRINSGVAKVGDKIVAIDPQGNLVESNKIFKIIRRYGMSQIEMAKAVAGDIVSIAGFTNATVTHTLNEQGKNVVIPSISIDPPMLSIDLSVNTSPLVGKEGTKYTSSQIRERLVRESENDVALKINFGDKTTSKSDSSFEIQGRGDLHLGVLIEKMRREGFEMSVTPPKVVLKNDAKKGVMEPIEILTIEAGHDHSAAIMENVTNRRGTLVTCEELSKDKQRTVFHIPTRGLIGLRSELLNETKGTAIVTTEFLEYSEYRGHLKTTRKGAMICPVDGSCTPYGIKELEVHGTMFVKPGQKVYNGMVIGEHLKEEDIELNPTKEKKLTNIRSVGSEEKVILQQPKIFTLEEAISYVRDDEIIEVTPENIRIRKKELDPNQRKRQRRDLRNEKNNEKSRPGK
jgi:GTP-binding protein